MYTSACTEEPDQSFTVLMHSSVSVHTKKGTPLFPLPLLSGPQDPYLISANAHIVSGCATEINYSPISALNVLCCYPHLPISKISLSFLPDEVGKVLLCALHV